LPIASFLGFENRLKVIPFWILDFGFWILKVLPVASLKNSNVALDKPKWY
jgi:hypothetical protein